MTEPPTPPGSLPNHNPPDQPLNHMFQESIRSTQWEIQHQKQHVKQHVKHWFFAGAGKGNFQLPDTAAVSPFSQWFYIKSSTQEFYLCACLCLLFKQN